MTVYVQGQILDVVSKPYTISDERGQRSGTAHQIMVYCDGDLCKISLSDEREALQWTQRIGEVIMIRCKLFSAGKLRMVYDGTMSPIT